MAPAVSAVAVNVARYAVTPGGQRRGATPGKVRRRECAQEILWLAGFTNLKKKPPLLEPDTMNPLPRRFARVSRHPVLRLEVCSRLLRDIS